MKSERCILILGLLLAFLFFVPDFAEAKGSKGGKGGGVSVRGYTTKSGKYVKAHERTRPDKSKSNNWSTKGNVNPYTGKAGAK